MGRMLLSAVLVLASAASLLWTGAGAQEQPSVAFKTDIQAAENKNGASSSGGLAAAPGSVNTGAANLGINEKIIDSAVQDIAWVGEELSGIIFVLSAGNILYRSKDGGKTWVNQMPIIGQVTWALAEGKAPVGVSSMVKSPADPNFVLFTANDGMHFATADGGASYAAVDCEAQLGEIRLHPRNTKLMLAAALTDRCGDAKAGGACYKQLHGSLDGGQSWKMLRDYVVQFDWAQAMKNGMGDTQPEESILFSAVTTQKGHQKFGKWDSRVDLYMTADFFANERLLVERGNRFLFTDKYLAVAQVDKSSQFVQLVLSGDGARTFREVGMPYDIGQHSYTILDTSEGTVFLHVNHNGEGAKWGNVYISNAIGTNFSLSLPYNRRDHNGKCDFEKLQSMEGVYVANFYDNALKLEQNGQHKMQAASMGQAAAKTSKTKGAKEPSVVPVVHTVITFDKGAVWEYLNPPKSTVTGANSACKKSKHCSLHLHGVTDVFGPFYSTPSAIGILMATGCVGDRLCFREGTIDTYLSRDGGHEWFEVAKGSHIYEIGDHGGLIVMAYDEQPTTLLMYSWNEGETWESHDFSDTGVLVDNIMIEPGSTSTRFLIYGTRESSAGGRIGVLFHVDFSELHQRPCTGVEIPDTDESDYELWSPSAGPNQEGCLLGHELQYVRRKRSAACFNGEELERVTKVKDCECTELDYECDVGYKREIGKTECLRDPMVVVNPASIVPISCPPGGTYQVTLGYRRVAGDTCIGGVQHPTRTESCPNTAWHQRMAPSRWFVLVLGLVLALALCTAQYLVTSSRSANKGVGACLRFSLASARGVAAWAYETVLERVAGRAAGWGRSRGGGAAGGMGMGAAAPQFGGSNGLEGAGAGGAAAAAEYKRMGEGEGVAEPDSWEADGADEFAFGEDGADEFAFDGAGDDELNKALADLGDAGTDEDLLGLPSSAAAGPSPSPAQVPKLRAPRSAKTD